MSSIRVSRVAFRPPWLDRGKVIGHRLRRLIAASLPLLLVPSVLVSCGKDTGDKDTAAPAVSPSTTGGSGSAAATTSPPPDPAASAANELGDVPVLMYHRIVAKPGGVYDRTPEDFRSELERLAQERYVPVTAADYTAGRIDIPAGTHPVVLTFDDGDASQFKLTPQGTPVPGTAVAIMQDVAGRFPGFRAVATFYVNSNPFGDNGGTKTLPWLRDHGMDIGNHTLTHANLRQAGAAEAQREISQGDQAVRRAVPGYEPATLALPFGVHPRDEALALAGSSDGTAYKYRGVFLVGANPAPSPFAADFDPASIPRIRSQGRDGKDAQFASAIWLDKLAAAPAGRYTSDGVPGQIAYPRATANPIAAAYQGDARPY
jgi:peptidoglycan/xylan/chitin deacetylase (PgdA/CDA1 family)